MKDRQINFRVPAKVHAELTRAAKASGMSLSAWLEQLALTAAGASKLKEQLARVPRTPRGRR